MMNNNPYGKPTLAMNGTTIIMSGVETTIKVADLITKQSRSSDDDK